MKRILTLALVSLLVLSLGCTAGETAHNTQETAAETTDEAAAPSASEKKPEESMQSTNPIDGTYIYAPQGTNGVYAEYVIDTAAQTLTLNEVNIFDNAYRKESISVKKLKQDGNDWSTEDGGMTFTAAKDGSLAINHGAAYLPRETVPQAAAPEKNPIATITMQDGGTMTLELYPNVAPNTVANFVTLANSGFYDGLTFHRIYAGFMIQGGDPAGNGSGGPGYSIKGEFAGNGFTQNDLSHKRGVISMARAQDPDSAGSQFFIMHADSAFLNAQYAAFGMLTDGFETLDQIAATPVTVNSGGEKSLPLKDVVIESIRVETFGVDYGNFEKIS